MLEMLSMLKICNYVVMAMYSLIEYSIYIEYIEYMTHLEVYISLKEMNLQSIMTEILNVALNNSSSFKCKESLLGKATDADDNDRSLKNTKIVVPLKCLSNFFR